MTRSPPTVWRLLVTPPADGAFNMAVDELLMSRVRDGAPPTLRLYAWNPPCVSLGRNQPASGHYDAEALSAAGVDLVRRITGGRAVLHDRELTYAVVAPARALGTPRAAYRAINRILVDAVGRLGAHAMMYEAAGRRTPPISTAPCFAEPAAHEVVSSGRKLIGSAQLCERGVILQHGSIPLRRSPILDRLNRQIADLLDGRPAELASVAGTDIGWAALADAIMEAWSEGQNRLEDRPLSAQEEASARALADRYRSERWTWRR